MASKPICRVPMCPCKSETICNDWSNIRVDSSRNTNLERFPKTRQLSPHMITQSLISRILTSQRFIKLFVSITKLSLQKQKIIHFISSNACYFKIIPKNLRKTSRVCWCLWQKVICRASHLAADKSHFKRRASFVSRSPYDRGPSLTDYDQSL